MQRGVWGETLPQNSSLSLYIGDNDNGKEESEKAEENEKYKTKKKSKKDLFDGSQNPSDLL